MHFYKTVFPVLFILALLVSCAHTHIETSDSGTLYLKTLQKENQPVTLLFGGDIMAHTNNFKPGHFDRIWADITPIIHRADLAFANIEAPVNDKADWSSYPQFNMHTPYVEAAVKAGFNVFSLANNHANDQGLTGIRATESYFSDLCSRPPAPGEKQIWASGLKKKSADPLSCQVISVKGWVILFVAVTELLNQPSYASYINYYPSTAKSHERLITELAAMRAEHPCDLFVVSVHTDETEYVRTITESHRTFFNDLLQKAGADIVWANHPHVVKEWELEGSTADNKIHSLIMYANGNTISAQRTQLNTAQPTAAHEYVGNGLLLQVTLTKPASSSGKPVIEETKPFFITTYITPARRFVVKLMDDDFIHSLNRSELSDEADYYEEQKKSMEKIQGNILWQ